MGIEDQFDLNETYAELAIKENPRLYKLYEKVRDELIEKYGLPRYKAIKRAVDYVMDETGA